MAVKKNIFIITVFAIIILGFAIYPVLANDAAEEKAATVEKAAEATAETTEKVSEVTAESTEKVAEETAEKTAEEATAKVKEVSGQK